jgi:hypothetical protein
MQAFHGCIKNESNRHQFSALLATIGKVRQTPQEALNNSVIPVSQGWLTANKHASD